jgi:lipopolysaccharide export system protein LptA
MNTSQAASNVSVIPAKTGTHRAAGDGASGFSLAVRWVPAFAGMTVALLMAFSATAQTVDTSEAAAEARSGKEVNIESNTMELLDDAKKAIFRGKVVAMRGDIKLNCETLVVNYTDVEQPDGARKTEVTFLDAAGKVLIKTRTQTVTGAWAKMDVKTNEVTVGGGVKVVQGSNIITGDKLFVDLDTNKSQVTGGRVKGSFLPKQ